MTRARIRRGILLSLIVLVATGSASAADLIELYTRASEYDPTFQIARHRREQAEQRLNGTLARVRPEITATADVGAKS